MFEGKTILVTGGTSGIGFALAQSLIEDGANVIVVGRNVERLEQLRQLQPERVQVIAFDLTRLADYQQTFASVGKVDGLVCSAGVADSVPLRFFSLEKYQHVVDINQTAPITIVAELARSGKLNAGAAVVFLSSIMGTRIGRIGGAAYAGTKAALTGFAKVMALEFASKGIRVNCLAPGMVNTEMASGQAEVSEQARVTDMARYPLGKRYAQAGEVVAAIRFLLSSQSSFITGETITMDGGFSIQ